MRDLTEDTLTEETIRRLQTTADPRLRQISGALVRHLHAFIKEIEPTQNEWAAGVDFLTRVGQMCDDKRQEFILLSDVLGVSMLVDAINHRMPQGATESTVLGPFFVDNRPSLPLGANMAARMPGTPMFINGSVRDLQGNPIVGAAVDIWHSDEEGYYDVQHAEAEPAMRGRFMTNDQGRFWLWSVRPKYYPIPSDGPVGEMLAAQGRHPFRPEHVHFMISAPGYETLVTHVFAEDDPYLDSDVVFGVKNSLVTPYIEHPAGLAPDGSHQESRFVELAYDFALKAD